MSTIRRQSIISSFIVYFGFALGFFNTYLFARGFTEAQYGLVGAFIAIANVMYSVANLGSPFYITKFYPYYKDNLPDEQNDQFAWALLSSLVGFLLVVAGGIICKGWIVAWYGNNSPELITYYNWLFPFGFGLTLFSLLEAFAWQLNKSVFSGFLREVQFRLFSTLLIVLTFANIIRDFDLFIKLYSLTYIAIALILFAYLLAKKKVHLHFSVSRVTKKFFKKIVTLMGFLWGGGLVFNIAQVFDTLVIAAILPSALVQAGIYTLAQNVASLVQAPQRAVAAAAVGPLSRAWKDKDLPRIHSIYRRSSINQLIFAVGVFTLIWINFTDGVLTFKLKEGYLDAKPVFLYIGLTRLIDLGTGLNAQIISTSVYWRFEFVTGLILLTLTLPMNYLLTQSNGIIGTAVSNLVAMGVYNLIRYIFLLKKFNMQPFTRQSLYTLLLGAAGYFVCDMLFDQYTGLLWLFVRSIVFLVIFGGGVILLNLSPDVKPVLQTVGKRLGFFKGE